MYETLNGETGSDRRYTYLRIVTVFSGCVGEIVQDYKPIQMQYKATKCLLTSGIIFILHGLAKSDSCESVVCQNGGTCIDYDYFQMCQCALGYMGSLCQEKFGWFHDTTPSPNQDGGGKCWGMSDCNYNGYCVDDKCVCSYGYTGRSCENSIHYDCSTMGDCNYNGFCYGGTCECDDTYYGDNCQFRDSSGFDSEDDEGNKKNAFYVPYVLGFVVVIIIAIAVCMIRLAMRSNRSRHPNVGQIRNTTPRTAQYQYRPSWYQPFESRQGQSSPYASPSTVQHPPPSATGPTTLPSAPMPTAPPQDMAADTPPMYSTVSDNNSGGTALPPPPSYDAAIRMKDDSASPEIPTAPTHYP